MSTVYDLSRSAIVLTYVKNKDDNGLDCLGFSPGRISRLTCQIDDY